MTGSKIAEKPAVIIRKPNRKLLCCLEGQRGRCSISKALGLDHLVGTTHRSEEIGFDFARVAATKTQKEEKLAQGLPAKEEAEVGMNPKSVSYEAWALYGSLLPPRPSASSSGLADCTQCLETSTPMTL